MDLISRKTAKAAGLKYYFTGKQCRQGHIEPRFVCSFICMECAREQAREIYHQLEPSQRRELRAKRADYLKQWRAKNRDRVLESYKAHNERAKQENPDYFKRYYAANKERRMRESQEWYRANSALALENRKVYVAANPDKARAWGRKSALTRRARQLQAFVEVVDPRVVFDRDHGICGICLTPINPASPWELDHKIPLSRGGEHSYQNTQVTHRRCNRSKGSRVLL